MSEVAQESVVVFGAYPGHFDGNPLVPGAALLEAVQDAVISKFPGRFRAFGRIRFLGMVRPGQSVQIVWNKEQGKIIFSMIREQEIVVRGSGDWEEIT